MSWNSRFPWDNTIRERRVLTGACALARNGLTTGSTGFLEMFTSYKEFDGFQLGVGRFIYNEEIDYDNYVTPAKTNPLILVPTAERALVEYIKIEKWCDEGTLIEALKTYIELHENFTKLFKVSTVYGVSKKTLEYWIQEAEADEEV